MKKFIPYIFITIFIGAFLMLSFVSPFSAPKMVMAQTPDGPTGDNTNKTEQVHINPNDSVYTSKYAEEIKSDGDLNKYANSADKTVKPISGGSSWGARIVDASIGYGLSLLASLIYLISGMILNMSAFLMEAVIHFTVTNFKVNIESIGVIDTGYGIILNLANMIFIFILLYIAIKTILGMGGDIKKLLTNVIIVALLINFSLFMTKVIIDASNVLSIGFLNAIKTDIGGNKTAVGSVATAWMSGLRLQTEAYNPNADVIKEDPSKGFHNVTMTIQYLGGSALNLVTAFVFFAVSFLFITRFIALLFYLIFSPVAFLGIVSDELKEHSGKWWKGLQSQVIFAPAFLLMAYLVSTIIKSGALWRAVGGEDGPNSGFLTAIGTGFTSGFPIVLNYIILIALMIGALITAKAMASEGSGGMVKYADKFRGWMQGVAGRNTIGRAAYLASRSELINNLAAKSPTWGGFAKTRLDSMADAKFGKDNKKGYSQTLKDSIEKKKKMADSIAKSKTRGIDKSIREDQSLIDERALPQSDLSRKALESEKKFNDLRSKHEAYAKLLEDVERLEMEYEELDKVSRLPGATPAQTAATASANQKLTIAEGNLLNEQTRLSGLGVNVVSHENDLTNAKLDRDRDAGGLEYHTRDTAKIINRRDNLTKQRENIRSKMKSKYTKNLPFASFGESLWGDRLGFLDEVFPSYTDGADEIRKVKTDDEKAIMEMIKKLAAEEAKKQSVTP